MPKHPPKTRCPRTAKFQYDTEDNALHDAARIILRNAAIWMRAYQCPHCDTWHLTSQPVRVNPHLSVPVAASYNTWGFVDDNGHSG